MSRRWELEQPAVILVFRALDEDSVTVIGHFDNKAECQEWAGIDGSAILTPGVHKPVAYTVMPPDYSERVLTQRFIGGFRPIQERPGFFQGGMGIVSSVDGEVRDGVPTVVVTRIPVTDERESGLAVVTVPMGIFASSQDARKWVNQIDSYYPRLEFGECVRFRPVLTPDQFVDKVEEFRLKGQVA